jgi:general secretion pathway protein G
MPTTTRAAARYAAAPQAAAAQRARGLTLIEILIVIALLLILGGLLLVNFMPQKEHAEVNTQKIQFNEIDVALQQFKLNLQRYPTEEEGLAVLWDKTQLASEDEASKWVGPYVKKPIKDVWGSEVVYHYPGELNQGGYDLISPGPDKQEGTEDDVNNSGSQGTGAGSADTGDGFAPPPTEGGGAGTAGGG